jgi:2-keto-3-deoxy-L-rhamnonate aldolase RhmA
MKDNAAKRKLQSGRPVTVVAPGHVSASLVEFVSKLGFDAVFLDQEHGGGSWEDLEHMVRAAEVGGATPIIRVQANDAAIITRSLDRGAGGIQVPHVNTRDQAIAAVEHAKYAPLGHRGWFTGRATYGQALATYPGRANDETMVVITLEETEALQNLDEILTVDGVDVFFVAPGDLAQSMGYPGRLDQPEVQTAIDDAIRRIRDANRTPGVLVTAATVERYLDMGALYLFAGLGGLIAPSLNDFLARARR